MATDLDRPCGVNVVLVADNHDWSKHRQSMFLVRNGPKQCKWQYMRFYDANRALLADRVQTQVSGNKVKTKLQIILPVYVRFRGEIPKNYTTSSRKIFCSLGVPG